MTNAPRLTVALPTCEGSLHLASTLRSVLDQGTEFDLLVVDDRSTDATVALARDLAGDRARIAVNPERLGLAGNWNRCVELSQPGFVAIVHQDDVLRPGHLRAHRDVAAANPGVGLIASAAVAIDADGAEIPARVVERGGCGPVDRWYGPGAFVAELLASNPLRCSGVTVNVDAHRRVGGFDSSWRYVVDWDFWVRVASGFPVAWLGAPTVAFRWHPASETQRFRHGTADLDESATLVDRLLPRPARTRADASLRRAADRRLARAYLNRAYQAAKAGDGDLARRCLGRSIRLAPTIAATIARDPRLVGRLLLGVAATGRPKRSAARP